MAKGDLVVAMTGASGVIYGVRLVRTLLDAGRTVHFVLSPAATEVIAQELSLTVDQNFEPATLFGREIDASRLHCHHYKNLHAGIASGSFVTAGMAICPCSMGTIGAIASGTSGNLIHRAADVHLKERRKLIVVPRETPLGLIQLRNLVALAEAGAIVLPAMPAFYSMPQSIDDMVDFVVGRICDQFGVEHRLAKRWGS